MQTLWETLKDNSQNEYIHINKVNKILKNSPSILQLNMKKSSEERKSLQSGLKIQKYIVGKHLPLTANKVKKMAQINKRQKCEQNKKSLKINLPVKRISHNISPTHNRVKNMNRRVEEIVKGKQDYYIKNYEEKRMRDEEELIQCSFQPEINRSQREPLQGPNIGDKHQELFEMSK